MTLSSYTLPECRDIRAHLDSYLSGELLVETTETVQAHLTRCAACRGELERWRALRGRLREALAGPAEGAHPAAEARRLRHLEASILAGVDAGRPLWRRAGAWGAIAATALLATALWRAVPPRSGSPGPVGTETATAAYAVDATLYADAARSHDLCALRRDMPATPPTPTAAADRLEAYWGLPAAVSADLVGHLLVDAHICRNGKRAFAHMILRKDDRTSSVFVTGKLAGGLPADDTRLPADGADLHYRREGDFAIAAVESVGHVGLVVEDARQPSSHLAASTLARDLSEYLKQLERQ